MATEIDTVEDIHKCDVHNFEQKNIFFFCRIFFWVVEFINMAFGIHTLNELNESNAYVCIGAVRSIFHLL